MSDEQQADRGERIKELLSDGRWHDMSWSGRNGEIERFYVDGVELRPDPEGGPGD